MNVALGTMCRNSAWYLPRFFGQAALLGDALAKQGATLRLIVAEGDSVDDTWEVLTSKLRSFDEQFGGESTLLKKAHGGKHAWHSVDIPERWAALEWVCNGILGAIRPLDDAFLYVESDLAWQPEVMLTLLSHLKEKPAVAPMCFTAVNDFYDIWGHIKNGVNFSPFPPYHAQLASEGLTEVDSVGSSIAMTGDLARRVTFGGKKPHFRGLGDSIRDNGGSLWVDPSVRVVHL